MEPRKHIKGCCFVINAMFAVTLLEQDITGNVSKNETVNAKQLSNE